MMGNPLMNDAPLSQTAGRTKTRQPGLLVKPKQIVLSSYTKSCNKMLGNGLMNDAWLGQTVDPAKTGQTSLNVSSG
jgi:hypothetical protein